MIELFFNLFMIVAAIAFLEKNWKIFMSAPWMFAILTGGACFAGYQIASWKYEVAVMNAESSVKLYEAKLAVSSPDEAVQKMELYREKFISTVESATNELKLNKCVWTDDVCKKFMPDVVPYSKEVRLGVVKEMKQCDSPYTLQMLKDYKVLRDKARMIENKKAE